MKKSMWPSWSENKLFTILTSVFLIALILFVGFGFISKIKAYDYIGVSPEEPNTISVSGTGKVTAIPDIATVTLGTEYTEDEVALAQNKVTEDINNLIEILKDEYGIEKKDIKTINYSIYPDYDWIDGERFLKGYRVSQNVQIKIRETENAGEILALAGQLGLKTVGGLSFTIDEPEEYKQEARKKALQNAKEKAEELAEVAGVKLGKIVSFSESEAPSYDKIMRAPALMEAGRGEGVEAPQIEMGSQEIEITAAVEYEIL
jgi:hypothetical protein